MKRTRTLMIGVALTLALAVCSSTAMAKDVDLPKISPGDLKAACDRQGGKFNDFGEMYGCTKACAGGKCGIICEREGDCFGVTPGNRAQVPAGDRGIADVLNATLDAPQDQGNKGFSWGLLGLLGFSGLVGLVRLKTK